MSQWRAGPCQNHACGSLPELTGAVGLEHTQDRTGPRPGAKPRPWLRVPLAGPFHLGKATSVCPVAMATSADRRLLLSGLLREAGWTAGEVHGLWPWWAGELLLQGGTCGLPAWLLKGWRGAVLCSPPHLQPVRCSCSRGTGVEGSAPRRARRGAWLGRVLLRRPVLGGPGSPAVPARLSWKPVRSRPQARRAVEHAALCRGGCTLGWVYRGSLGYGSGPGVPQASPCSLGLILKRYQAPLDPTPPPVLASHVCLFGVPPGPLSTSRPRAS